jgi:peptide/nickel transport system permease protein
MTSRLRFRFAFVVLLAGIAIAAPVLAPRDPLQSADSVALKKLPPSFAYPFGTDPIGRDVLSRVIYGARVSLEVASASVALSLLLGTCYGAGAAMSRPAVDTALMRLLDVALAIPRLLVLLAVSAIWHRSGEGFLIVLLGLTGWFDVARLVRSEVAALLARDFVLAGRALGVRRVRLVWRHIMPHVLPTLAVTATLGVASTIALEAGISYLGFGVQPPYASWGSIIWDGHEDIRNLWWLTLFPGAATVLAVLACNALGDALRDSFAPKQLHG